MGSNSRRVLRIFFFQIFLSHMHFHDKQQKQNGVAEKGSSERKVKILVN